MVKFLTGLSKLEERVYVLVKNEEIRKRFLQDAEDEGFTIGGEKPTEKKEKSDIYALNDNCTLSFAGFTGHMAFKHADSVGGRRLLKIDYEKILTK